MKKTKLTITLLSLILCSLVLYGISPVFEGFLNIFVSGYYKVNIEGKDPIYTIIAYANEENGCLYYQYNDQQHVNCLDGYEIISITKEEYDKYNRD